MSNTLKQKASDGLKYLSVNMKSAIGVSKSGTIYSITYARILKRSLSYVLSMDVANLLHKKAISINT